MPPAITSLFERFGGVRRVLIALVGLAAAALILVVSRWASAPQWVPAFQNVPIETVSQITDQLTQGGIAFKLERGGSDVLVASTDVPKARVLLAKGGVLPGGSGGAGSAGWALFDAQQFGKSDFDQKIAFRRAMEGELEKTITKMQGIERTRVSLALNESATFRRQTEKPITAAVVLALKSGTAPSADVVQGIQHLVAASVSGLEPDNVSVHDNMGRMLSQPADAGSTGLSTRQLTVRKEYEIHAQEKAQLLLDQMVGVGNARVEVSAEVNFDKVARTSSTVDPDKQALATEQKAEIIPGADGGAGSTNSANAYVNSIATETVENAPGSIRRLSVAVLVNNRIPVPPAPSTDTTKKKTLAQDSIAAAALVPQPRSATELAMIESLVRRAVGADSARGDIVSVVNMPFETTLPSVTEVKPTVWDTVEKVQRPAISVFGIALAGLVGLLALRALKAPAAPAARVVAGGALPALPLSASAANASLPDGPGGAVLIPKAAPRFEVQVGNTVLRDQTIQVVEQNPDDAARLMRVWLREA
jgi:flagellar M-ring protein FliF